MVGVTQPDVPRAEPLDDAEAWPMTDREHLATFGWAWDDPNATEVEA